MVQFPVVISQDVQQDQFLYIQSLVTDSLPSIYHMFRYMLIKQYYLLAIVNMLLILLITAYMIITNLSQDILYIQQLILYSV